MLRNCSRLAKGLTCWAPLKCSLRVAEFHGDLLHPPHTPSRAVAIRSSHSGEPKDYGLPNASWSPAMMEQYHKFTELSKDKTWTRVPSYRVYAEQIPGRTKEEVDEARKKGNRLFVRNLDLEGAGFEYVMFFNSKENRLVTLFQPGPYLEGPPGFVHGGAIATIIDTMIGACAIATSGRVMTANLNINYRSPLALSSVVLGDCKLDRKEGRKVFLSCQLRSVDGQTLHTEATALFIQLDPKKSS